jgi:hypothetical protein
MLQFDEETTTYEFFTQNPPVLHMGLYERVFANVALNFTFISVNQMLAISTSMLGANLQSGHFYGDFLAKQEQRVQPV